MVGHTMDLSGIERMQVPGAIHGRGGKSQDKQGLVEHLRDFGPCPTNNEKPLKSFDQSRNIITFLRRHQAAVGRDYRGRRRDKRGRQQAKQGLTEGPEEEM